MQYLLQRLGRTLHWLMTPGLMLVLPFTKRTRVLLRCGDQVVVVRAWLSDGRWQLPGGGLHRGETPAAGALRELREETDIILPLEKLGDPRLCQFREGVKRFKYYLFTVEIGQAIPPRRRLPEIIDCEWVDYHTLSVDNAGSDVINAIETIEV